MAQPLFSGQIAPFMGISGFLGKADIKSLQSPNESARIAGLALFC